MNIDDLTLGEARKLAALFGGATVAPSAHPYAAFVGRTVVVRSHLSGVWHGTLTGVSGTSGVNLTGARRAWHWTGAATCSGLAIRGPTGGKIAGPVDMAIPETIEIVTSTPEAVAAWTSVTEWAGR